MGEWSIVNRQLIQHHNGRIDSEYYKQDSLEAYNLVKNINHKPLGYFVSEGYRVVYENTKILKPEFVDKNKDVLFLQSANVSSDGLWIEPSEIGYVTYKDWKKYPKGHIKHGELLIEVKGQAEKVAIVQDYMPLNTLVTGTLFKMSIKKDLITPEYIYAFFSCKYGKILRDRTKVNSLISYVSKPELYNIPIPVFSDAINEITNYIKESYNQTYISHSLYREAEDLLNKELGLDTLVLPNSKWYSTDFNSVVKANRCDGEFFDMRLRLFYQHFKQLSNVDLKNIQNFAQIKKFSNPDYSDTGLPIITQKHLGKISPENYGDFPIASFDWCNKNQNAILRKNDLLFYSVGAYLGKTNLWLNNDKAVFASFITLLRCDYEYDAGYLMMVLNSTFGIMQSKIFQSGTSQPYIYPKDIKQFMIPDVDKSIKIKIHKLLVDSFVSMNKSKQLLDQAKQRIEELIEQQSK